VSSVAHENVPRKPMTTQLWSERRSSDSFTSRPHDAPEQSLEICPKQYLSRNVLSQGRAWRRAAQGNAIAEPEAELDARSLRSCRSRPQRERTQPF